VPDAYIGVWKRTLLRAPGVEDTDSDVYWLQTRSWHADIRVPRTRPRCMGKLSLDQLTRDELFGLARQQGFCGTTQVDGDTCRWLRVHDYQPPSGKNDIGRMVFENDDRLLEHGVEADYFEIWERLPESRGESFALQLADKPLTLLLGAGNWRMLVRPRAVPMSASPSLTALSADLGNREVCRLVDFEISFGGRASGHAWRIERSTLPWREGDELPLTT